MKGLTKIMFLKQIYLIWNSIQNYWIKERDDKTLEAL